MRWRRKYSPSIPKKPSSPPPTPTHCIFRGGPKKDWASSRSSVLTPSQLRPLRFITDSCCPQAAKPTRRPSISTLPKRLTSCRRKRPWPPKPPNCQVLEAESVGQVNERLGPCRLMCREESFETSAIAVGRTWSFPSPQPSP